MIVLICGGGVSGMMAAIQASLNGCEVILIERNEKLGKKLYITGKGRCNLTNAVDNQEFLKNVVNNPKFLMSSLNEFSSLDTRNFFEEHGVRLMVERGNRVFPESEKSNDIIKALKNEIERLKVDVRLNERVIKIIYKDNLAHKVITDKSEYIFDKLIIATGGASYKATGSIGDGYKFARDAGHAVIDVVPGLVAMECSFVYNHNNNTIPLCSLASIEGLSLKNVKVSAFSDNKLIKSDFGEMLFTDKGFSGPIILSLSSYINRLDLKKLKLVIDLKPALTNEVLDARILRDFEVYKNKQLKNTLNDLLPNSLIPFIIKLSGIDENKPVNSITREERKIIVRLLKELTFSISALQDIDRAIITSGGVSTNEINPKTMQSKKINNLYFAGEVIDVDALTGGFNIQIALSTGYTAGKNILL